MSVIFILVNPAVPANVGAAARAINTMGFKELRLVNPCEHLSKEAKMLAHASHDILENTKVFNSLKDALHDIDFVIGTTARRRTVRNRFVLLNQLPEIIRSKGDTIHQTAMVFGSEESGLSNEDTTLCHILSTVPMAIKYPSLNLSQAVMVYAYELSELAGKKTRKKSKKAHTENWKALQSKSELLLHHLQITPENPIHSKLIERLALLGEDDISLLHVISGKVLGKLG